MNMNKGIGFVVELVATLVLMALVYYFTRVDYNLLFALISFISGLIIIFVLRHIMRKSNIKVYDSKFRRDRLNTLTTDGRILMAAALGFFFASILLVIVTVLIGPLPTFFRISFFIISWIVGAIIGDTLRKALQNTKLAF
ncbi:MAG: hypothetical protein FWB84_00110 [Candidatus Bathyarchaeota archaeon]|uniref:hypothetical protein n=1 Tax=Candidatus Bathycorpusculum sp. TaxID=2994959 RepID=UPI00281AA71F|nr:hypothetical protein [Candidatus Termiticorpusculum sp.]MCL2256609.1 hypothetical protein [Candidatus Termiticorpusculum sp.]MCL2293231.1 hypothetical protein [Candidatus Termiticorpusculum sp.]